MNIFVVAWYQATNGKIQSLKVVFDLRPVPQAQAKQTTMAEPGIAAFALGANS